MAYLYDLGAKREILDYRPSRDGCSFSFGSVPSCNVFDDSGYSGYRPSLLVSGHLPKDDAYRKANDADSYWITAHALPVDGKGLGLGYSRPYVCNPVTFAVANGLRNYAMEGNLDDSVSLSGAGSLNLVPLAEDLRDTNKVLYSFSKGNVFYSFRGKEDKEGATLLQGAVLSFSAPEWDRLVRIGPKFVPGISYDDVKVKQD